MMNKRILIASLLLSGLGFSTGSLAQPDPATAWDRLENVDDSMARGEAVYEHWCSHCHDGGRGMPGTQSLRVKYEGELPAELLEREDLNAEAIKLFVRSGVLSMPPFRKTEITDEELDDLAAYITR